MGSILPADLFAAKLQRGDLPIPETISIEQASTRLAELVHSLGPSDEIVLTENDQPVARIVLNKRPPMPRIPGLQKGQLTIISDDDDHLEDFKDYMP